MADIKIAPEDVYTIDSEGNVFPCVYPNKPIGIAIEDSRPIDDSDGELATSYPDGHVVKIAVSGSVQGCELVSTSGRYITDAQQALGTLPRVIRSMIYRYAKWRLRCKH